MRRRAGGYVHAIEMFSREYGSMLGMAATQRAPLTRSAPAPTRRYRKHPWYCA
jgi:hypothetical protein